MNEPNQTIVFRVDSSLSMGTGHVMRCLTLASALKTKGAESLFVCREQEGNLVELIRSKGYVVHTLPVRSLIETSSSSTNPPPLAHAAWLSATQIQDATECTPILAELQPDWLVVDHYALDARWELQLKPHYRQLMAIDDLADRTHICDVLLDQTFGRASDDYSPLVPEYCSLLCGSQYALLRPEFRAFRPYSLQRREQPQLQHLLITMGGVDKEDATGLVLEALRNCPLPQHLEITVVMGQNAPWIAEVTQKAKSMPWPTTVRVGVDNLAKLMADSDLAVGAAGATAWERCCLGLPSLMAVIAKNQHVIARNLAAQGAAISIGNPLAPEFIERTREGIRRLWEHPEFLKQMSHRAASLVDGEGAIRTINYLTRKIDQ